MAAVSSFIPNVWGARFIERLRDELVFGRVVNRNYEGDISQYGDTVKVPTPSTAITVRDYQVDTDIANAETTSGTTQDLDIDKQKYFHFLVDDIDRAQSKPDIMDDAMGEAARQMAVQVDKDIATELNLGYNSSRAEAAIADAPTATTWGAKFLDAISAVKRKMTVADIPLSNRWIIVHPETIQGLEKRFTTNAGSDNVLSLIHI